MAGASSADFLLFVAGEPGPAVDRMQDVESSVARRMVGSALGAWWSRSVKGSGPSDTVSPPSGNEAAWHLPPQQIQCANLVLDIAERLGKTVVLVDVNRPSGLEDLVHRWVGVNGVVPLLVRRDGARLQGFDEFVPGTVRRFIVGGRP